MRNALVASLFLVTSCGGSGGGGSFSGVDQFCPAFFDTLVTKFADCLGGSKESIEKAFGIDKTKSCERLIKSVTAKRATYSGQHASGCIRLIQDATCDGLGDALDGVDNACDKTLVGTVAQSGSCFDDVDCMGESYCTETAATCPGVCKAKVAAGGSGCQSDDDCVGGTSCRNGTCLTNASSGSPCGGSTDVPCKAGLYCQGSTVTQTGTCMAQQTSGQCTSDEVCAQKYRCVGRGATTPGVCTMAKAKGAACTPGSNECQFLTYCATSGGASTCTDWPGPGSPCGVIGGEYALCLGGWCDLPPLSGMGTCKVYKNAGETCMPTAFGSQCGGDWSGNTCESGTCKAQCTSM